MLNHGTFQFLLFLHFLSNGQFWRILIILILICSDTRSFLLLVVLCHRTFLNINAFRIHEALLMTLIIFGKEKGIAWMTHGGNRIR